MGISYIPNPADAERYRRLRTLGRELSEKILETVPHRAFAEIGDAIGIRRNGVLAFDTMDMSGVLADCCIYDWFEDGKNLIERYAERHPASPGTDEAYLLDAYGRARYGILTIQPVVPDAGLYCHDILNKEEFFLMDLALSRSLAKGRPAIATRTVPLGEYWMTGGAGLPIVSAKAIEPALRQIGKLLTRDTRDGPAAVPTLIVRACLEAGAAEHVGYADSEAKPKERPRMPRWPGSKRHRRPI
jgi:hypothetical protein